MQKRREEGVMPVFARDNHCEWYEDFEGVDFAVDHGLGCPSSSNRRAYRGRPTRGMTRAISVTTRTSYPVLLLKDR
jgi:hypothetical protein